MLPPQRSIKKARVAMIQEEGDEGDHGGTDSQLPPGNTTSWRRYLSKPKSSPEVRSRSLFTGLIGTKTEESTALRRSNRMRRPPERFGFPDLMRRSLTS